MSAAEYGRPGTESAKLREALHKLLMEHEAAGELPTSHRFLFYELEQAGIVSKNRINPDTGVKIQRPDGPVIKALTYLRERGIVPWSWIADESRSLTEWEFAGSVAEYLSNQVNRARIDCWGESRSPLIACESKATAGVLSNLAAEYLCPIVPTGGQCGGLLHTDVAPVLANGNRPVLYLGDYDLAGGHIEENTRRVLESIVGYLDWQRIAITDEQIQERDLAPIHKTDKRYLDGHPHEAWEVEALGQGTVMGIVREALDDLLPEPLEAVLVREQAQRDDVTEALRDSLGEGGEG